METLLESRDHPGTQQFLSDIQELYSIKIDTAVAECDTGDKWLARRGELQALAMVLGYMPNAERELDGLDETHFSDEPEPDNTNPLED